MCPPHHRPKLQQNHSPTSSGCASTSKTPCKTRELETPLHIPRKGPRLAFPVRLLPIAPFVSNCIISKHRRDVCPSLMQSYPKNCGLCWYGVTIINLSCGQWLALCAATCTGTPCIPYAFAQTAHSAQDRIQVLQCRMTILSECAPGQDTLCTSPSNQLYPSRS